MNWLWDVIDWLASRAIGRAVLVAVGIALLYGLFSVVLRAIAVMMFSGLGTIPW